MQIKSKTPKPITLVVLDGWGYREDKEYNAIATAKTPVWDRLWKTCPHMLLSGSGEVVGLPKGQMGNSEVGHLHMGAGRRVDQELTRIDLAIETGEFFKNTVLCHAVDQAVKNKKAVHILGLLSPGGVHCHERHIYAMIELAHQRGAERIYIHAFLDGRDTPPRSAAASLRDLQSYCDNLGIGQIASIAGRYFAMDRDRRWDRTEQAYRLLVEGQAKFEAGDALNALQQAYDRSENDEFVQPTLICPNHDLPATLHNGDAVVFMNFRADRARQLTWALLDKNFDHFTRAHQPNIHLVTLTEYSDDIKAPVAFEPQPLKNGLGEWVAKHHLKQLRIAETEKYAHVTFFFNGGREAPFEGESRILVPSPKVTTYDLQPEMSAPQLTKQLTDAIRSQSFDVIICNYANPDMVGHTGNFAATVKAIEVIDRALGEIVAAAQAVGGEVLITADHGNAEAMYDEETKQAHTAHTLNPVPLVYVGRPADFVLENGVLSDLAPTLCHLLGLERPVEMTARNLLKFK